MNIILDRITQKFLPEVISKMIVDWINKVVIRTICFNFVLFLMVDYSNNNEFHN